MVVVPYSEARQNLAKLLEKASIEGEVLIRRGDGSEYLLQPAEKVVSPANWPGIDSGLTREQILHAVRENRVSY